MTVEIHGFGRMPDGRAVEAVTLDASAGLRATVLTYGATLQSLCIIDPTGREVELTLNASKIGDYLNQSHYLGATIGRYANRIAGTGYQLDGRHVRLECNEGEVSLHGGPVGFDRQVWEIASIDNGVSPAVELRFLSCDGDQGHPGNLQATARYCLDRTGQLSLDLQATVDAPSAVSLSHHPYWNLAGTEAPERAMGQILQIPAGHYLTVDAKMIPTGDFCPVAGTAFDFRIPKRIGQSIEDIGEPQIVLAGGYDHSWIFGPCPAGDRLMARLCDPKSERVLELFSNQPALQFYSGNYLDASLGRRLAGQFNRRQGIALEPQALPDSPNREIFPVAIVRPGEIYHNKIRYHIPQRR